MGGSSKGETYRHWGVKLTLLTLQYFLEINQINAHTYITDQLIKVISLRSVYKVILITEP